MPVTPERSRGESSTEGIQLDDLPVGNEPTTAGEIRLVDGELLARDGAGLFNLREGEDEKVKVSADDTSAGYLETKLSAVSPLSLTTRFSGGNEVREISIGGTASIFGTEYQHSENNALAFTTSTTFVQRHRWTTTSLPAGGYYVAIQATLDCGPDAGVSQEARVQRDDSTTLAKAAIKAGVDEGGGAIVSFVGHLALSGVHNFDVDWRKVAGNGSAGVRDVHCVLWRVS